MEGTIHEEQIDEAIAEFRNYLKLIALGHQNIAMTSSVVDEVWHTFILFTRDYAAFCHEVFGFFVHHVPNISDNPMQGAVQEFRRIYEAEFGPLPKIWLGATDDKCHGTTNCQPTPDGGGCNSWGGSED